MKTNRLALLVIFLTGFGVAGCGTPPPPAEETITTEIQAMRQAIVDGDTGPLRTRLHNQFKLQERNTTHDRKAAERLITGLLYYYTNISITLTNIQVNPDPVRDDKASATFNALVFAGRGGFLPETGQLFRIESTWELDGNDWKLRNAVARRALER